MSLQFCVLDYDIKELSVEKIFNQEWMVSLKYTSRDCEGEKAQRNSSNLK